MYKYASPHSRPSVRRTKIGEGCHIISVVGSLPRGRREALERGVQREAKKARQKAREEMGLPPLDEDEA